MSRESDWRPGYLIVAPWEVTSHGGVNGVIRNLVEQMRGARAFAPLILQSSWQHTRMSWVQSSGAPIALLRLRQPASGPGWIAGLRSFLTYLATFPFVAIQLRRLCARHRVVAINVHYASLSALTFVLMRAIGLFRGRLILSFHGSDIHAAATLIGFRRRLFAWLLSRVDSIVVVSKQLARFVTTTYPGVEMKVAVIYNGVRLDLFSNVRRKRALFAAKPVIICVASFDPVKGVDILLRAIPSVVKQCGSARFVLVGESGTQDDYLRRLASDLDVEAHIEWRCNVPHADIPALLAEADVFVLPSRDEALGMALLEAGAAGLPIVATRVGGIPEVIRGADEGVLVQPEDPVAIADAIVQLLRNTSAAVEMGACLQRSVTERFTWGAAYRRYAQLVQGTGLRGEHGQVASQGNHRQ